MSTNRRTTVYLEPRIHQAIRLKAAETQQTVSELVNRALRLALAEDAEDLSDLDARTAEPSRPFEEFLAELRAAGEL